VSPFSIQQYQTDFSQQLTRTLASIFRRWNVEACHSLRAAWFIAAREIMAKDSEPQMEIAAMGLHFLNA